MQTVDARMTPEQILHAVLESEKETHDLLERAAKVTSDPQEKALFERLASREEESLRDLQQEQDRLEAESFVQRALDC
jgi:rubrerythrin